MGSCGNCTAWQDGTYQVYQADPDIAGIGVSLDSVTPQRRKLESFREPKLTCRMRVVDNQRLHRECLHHLMSRSRIPRPY